MKKALATAALALLAALAAGPACAEPPSTASIETLLTMTRAESMLGTVYSGMEQAIRQGMQAAAGDQPLTPEQQRILDTAPTKFSALVRSEFTWDKLKPQYIQVYQETFTQEEVDGLIAFYASPAGQAFIAKMPTAMQKSMALVQLQMKTLMPKMQAVIRETMAEAQAAK